MIDKIKNKSLKQKEGENKIIEYNTSENDKMKEKIKNKEKEIKYRLIVVIAIEMLKVIQKENLNQLM